LNEWWEYLPVAHEMTKSVLCQEKSGFRITTELTILALEKRQYGQDFFGIWQRLRFQISCIILLSHIGQYYARLPDHLFTFVEKSQKQL